MENKPLPLVTIGIPTYNGNSKLLKPLESIWAQNYPNLEVIISDNCSTDNTQEIIEEQLKRHPQIRYIRQKENIGQMPNYYFLMKEAAGKYFMWVADDDTLEPGALWKIVEFMESHDEYSLVSGIIRYWQSGVPVVSEADLTFESSSPWARVARFYHRVIYGGLLHGVMRKELTKDITINYVIGNDYHFVANLAYLGKVKTLKIIGYNKNLGGVSNNYKQYAKHMGESWIVGHFPHFKIARDAFSEVVSRAPVFSSMSYFSRVSLGVVSYLGVLYCYYGRIFVGARLKNHIVKPIISRLRKSAANGG